MLPLIVTNVCPTLPTPANGSMRCRLGRDGVPNPGDTCDFSCDDGFTLEGRRRRTCTLQNGVARWNGQDSNNAVCVRGMLISNT